MKKLLIVYRATIDRHVQIGVNTRAEKKKKAERGMIYFIKERIRSI